MVSGWWITFDLDGEDAVVGEIEEGCGVDKFCKMCKKSLLGQCEVKILFSF